MELRKPLVWLHGVAPGGYEPAFPVWLVEEELARHQFVVALDETMCVEWSADLAERSPFDPVRRYAEAIVRTRLHQRVFRGLHGELITLPRHRRDRPSRELLEERYQRFRAAG